MASIDKTFAGKLIIKNLTEKKAEVFLERLIMNAWEDHPVPPSMRLVKASAKLDSSMLPKDFSVKDAAKGALKKGLLRLDKVGIVPLYLNLLVTKQAGTSPTVRIEIDKFEYEKEGNSLDNIVNKTISQI